MKLTLEPANLDWSENGTPSSREYGDIYFSTTDGLAESRYVFLDTNQLAPRFAAMDKGDIFTIAETGFGTGLNFLATLALWAKEAPAGANLHYFSVEKHPLTQTDLSRALERWPELKPYADTLLTEYPPLIAGFHVLYVAPNVRLTLMFGDATERFQSLCESVDPAHWQIRNRQVDAWFLDGFNPALNPDMWHKDLFLWIARLSGDGTTLATFTAASAVRKALSAVGFEVQKVPGFGRKREMIFAQADSFLLDDSVEHCAAALERPYKTRSRDWHVSPQCWRPNSRQAIVIGAGVAGLTSSLALANRGWNVTLVDQNQAPAKGASGNPQVGLYTRLSVGQDAFADFSWQALSYAQRYYRTLNDRASESLFDRCGLIQLPRHEKDAQQLAQVGALFRQAPEFVSFLDPQALSRIAGIPVANAGLWLSQSGVIHPHAFALQVLSHPNIHWQGSTRVDQLTRNQNWRVSTRCNGKSQVLEAPKVVICTGLDGAQLLPYPWLWLQPIRGQLSQFPVNESTRALRVMLCRGGSFSPARDGIHTAGATYGLNQTDTDPRIEDHHTNWEALKTLTSDSAFDPLTATAVTGVRAGTADHLPLVGPVPDADYYLQAFAALRKDAKTMISSCGSEDTGLYMNLGYGSRGYCYAPLSAEVLAAHMNREIAPVANALVQALHPARFIIRGIIRNKLHACSSD